MGRQLGANPMRTTEETWGEWYNRHRMKMNPIVAGILIGATGVLCAWLAPWWPFFTVSVAAWIVLFIVTGVYLVDYGQRAYFRLVTAAGVLWMMWLYTPWAVRWPWWTVVAWALGVLASCLGYWTDQRRIKKFELEDDYKSWPTLSAKIGLAKIRRSQKIKTESGWRIRLSWNPGDYTLDDIKSKERSIEGLLGVPFGQLKMAEIKDGDEYTRSNSIDAVCNTDSAARKAPVAFDRPTMKSILDEMFVGPYDGGAVKNLLIRWYVQTFGGYHTLAAGATRSGKSGLYKLMLAETAPCRDVIRLGIDAKGGVALRPWAPMFYWLVCGRDSRAQEEWVALLDWLDAVMIARENFMAEKGWGTWRVSRKYPLIILYVDEFAEVAGLKIDNFNIVQKLEQLCRMGAGVGVLLCAATQYPTLDAIASTQIPANIMRRFCFRVLETLHQTKIIPNSTHVDAMFRNKPGGKKGAGWCFYSDSGNMEPFPIRVRDVPDEKIFEIVTEFHDCPADLDPVSASVQVRREEREARRRWTLEDVDPTRDLVDEDDGEDEDPLTGNHEGNQARTVEGNQLGNEAGTTPGNEGEMIDDETPPGVPVALEGLLGPRTEEEVAAEDKAVSEWLAGRAAVTAGWDAEDATWSTERATAAFWATLRAATTAGDGVRQSDLARACHRSPSWVQERMKEARQAGQIVPLSPRSAYYKIAPGVQPPGLSDAA